MWFIPKVSQKQVMTFLAERPTLPSFDSDSPRGTDYSLVTGILSVIRVLFKVLKRRQTYTDCGWTTPIIASNVVSFRLRLRIALKLVAIICDISRSCATSSLNNFISLEIDGTESHSSIFANNEAWGAYENRVIPYSPIFTQWHILNRRN